MIRSAFLVLTLALTGCQPAASDAPAAQASVPAPAGAASATGTGDSAVAFAREFYALYTASAEPGGLPALDRLVATRPTLFTPELRAALERDTRRREAAAADGLSDGLDFDPFLASQDPCERYDVDAAAIVVPGTEAQVRVPVHAVCAGARSGEPVVHLVVVRAGSGWVVANALGRDPAFDLLQVLAPE